MPLYLFQAFNSFAPFLFEILKLRKLVESVFPDGDIETFTLKYNKKSLLFKTQHESLL